MKTTRAEPPFRTAVLALGSNLGAPEEYLIFGVRQLAHHLDRLRVASLYLTAPVSPIAQPRFLNTAVIGDSALDAEELLGLAKALELRAGRRRGSHLAPRTLDIDLLLFDDLCRDRPELTIPHPRLRQRRFFLAPLVDIAPDLPIPPDGVSARELLGSLTDDQQVQRVPWSGSGPLGCCGGGV